MRTAIKPDFSILGNDILTGKLNQLTSEFPITYIFHQPANEKEAAQIVIITEESQDVETIESRKWICNNKVRSFLFFGVPIWSSLECPC